MLLSFLKTIDVLCIGQVVADIVLQPLSSFTFEKDTTKVPSLEITNGGDAFNTAIGLTKLGVKTVLIAKVGNDILGKLLLKKAREYGIIAKGICVSQEDRTSTCVVMINVKGERVFVYYGGANDRLSCGDIDWGFVRRSRILHLGGIYNLPGIESGCMVKILEYARKMGLQTSMDVTWDSEEKWLVKIEPALPYLDYFLPSIAEAKEITGRADPREIAPKLISLGVGNVVIKLGERGCYIANEHEQGFVEAFEIEKVVDTTGAGDAFVAGFLTGLTRKWSFRDCARLGNAAGALSIQKVGATASMPSLADALSLLDYGD